jgi:hypothetical protein
MIEYLLLLGGALVSVYMLVKHKKTRQPPLKNSDKIAIEINTETALEALHIHLPQPHFIKNMSGAVEKERRDICDLWKLEKNKFPILWKKMSDRQRKSLIKTLLEELVFSIDIYSDSEKLLELLCPKINEKYLLSGPTQEDTDDASSGIFNLLLAVQDKIEIKQYCLPMLLLSVTRVEGELDPNREEKTDTVLAEHVDIFLRALQHLCAIKFAKQILLRYKIDPVKSFISRVTTRVGPIFVLGGLALLGGYLLDRYGVLEAILVYYKSPFN